MPEVGFSNPSRISIVVVLPAPLGPSRPKHSPARISKSSPRTASDLAVIGFAQRLATNGDVHGLHHSGLRRGWELASPSPSADSSAVEPLTTSVGLLVNRDGTLGCSRCGFAWSFVFIHISGCTFISSRNRSQEAVVRSQNRRTSSSAVCSMSRGLCTAAHVSSRPLFSYISPDAPSFSKCKRQEPEVSFRTLVVFGLRTSDLGLRTVFFVFMHIPAWNVRNRCRARAQLHFRAAPEYGH